MSRSFKINSGNRTFGLLSEPMDAGEYTFNKKAKATFCVANSCVPAVKVGSQGNMLLFNRSNRLQVYPCNNAVNKANLYINLLTKLDLKDVTVMTDFSGNSVPVATTVEDVPFLDYNIDPSGNLFGNTACGINNFVHYMVYNPKEL
jgi:hypothetical protein